MLPTPIAAPIMPSDCEPAPNYLSREMNGNIASMGSPLSGMLVVTTKAAREGRFPCGLKRFGVATWPPHGRIGSSYSAVKRVVEIKHHCLKIDGEDVGLAAATSIPAPFQGDAHAMPRPITTYPASGHPAHFES